MTRLCGRCGRYLGRCKCLRERPMSPCPVCGKPSSTNTEGEAQKCLRYKCKRSEVA